MKSVKSYHDDTIRIGAQKDKTLMHQAVKLEEALEWCTAPKKKLSFNIAVVNLRKQLRNFINVFNHHTPKFAVESEKRNLTPAQIDETQLSKDLIQLIVKFQEGLASCTSRHNSTQLSESVIKLEKTLDKFLIAFSKHVVQHGTEPVDKPSQHIASTEDDHVKQ